MSLRSCGLVRTRFGWLRCSSTGGRPFLPKISSANVSGFWTTRPECVAPTHCGGGVRKFEGTVTSDSGCRVFDSVRPTRIDPSIKFGKCCCCGGGSSNCCDGGGSNGTVWGLFEWLDAWDVDRCGTGTGDTRWTWCGRGRLPTGQLAVPST